MQVFVLVCAVLQEYCIWFAFFSGFEIWENATQLWKRFTIEGIFGDGPFHSCFLLMLMLDPHSELQQILHFHGCYKVVTKQLFKRWIELKVSHTI